MNLGKSRVLVKSYLRGCYLDWRTGIDSYGVIANQYPGIQILWAVLLGFRL